ncbi:GNAT family N-acetyltransferase [Kribbella sp. NPDC023855]|uniref:GNAT family N-acetyltransferase n=1 Tax=Kribbella sp. NPDC023855 TaxID=3154698 RepID=UPI003408DA4F
MTTIRFTTADDLGRLQSIEVAAGALFREIGMTDVAGHPPPSIETLERYRQAGLAWTAAGPDDQAIGYALVDLVDGAAHLEQVSVHPDHGRRGVGRLLIDEVDRWAAVQGLPALTLSTFRTVPWNAPYYARLGFRELAAGELTPGLVEVQRHEAALGLDPAERVFMRREIETGRVSG